MLKMEPRAIHSEADSPKPCGKPPKSNLQLYPDLVPAEQYRRKYVQSGARKDRQTWPNLFEPLRPAGARQLPLTRSSLPFFLRPSLLSIYKLFSGGKVTDLCIASPVQHRDTQEN